MLIFGFFIHALCFVIQVTVNNVCTHGKFYTPRWLYYWTLFFMSYEFVMCLLTLVRILS